MGIVVFAVAAEAEQIGDNHLRPATGTGGVRGTAQGFQAGLKVGAVDGLAFHSVACGAIRQIAASELTLVGGGVGVLIVGDDENQRQFFDRCLVQRFVNGAGGGGTIANA